MTMEETIKRINELYHKSKAEGLTPAEQEEQAMLRRKYVDSIKSGLSAQLDNMSIKNPDGSITPVKRKN